MMPRKTPLLLTAAAIICMSTTTTAFAPLPLSRSGMISSDSRNRPLNHVATPFEEKEDEMEKEKEDNDWTAVEGGFLPRIGRRNKTPLITEVSTLEDYKKEVVDCDEQIVVVKFFSTWCRSCKAMAPLYKKLANSQSDNPNIKFVQVPVTQKNALLHQGLGIPSVPFGHIYHKEAGLVEELKIKKQDFSDFKEVLASYVEGACNMDLAP